MSLSEIFQQLEDQLEDLQRNAKFCINSYDYHHKNNEHEILQSLQKILKDSYHDGREYQQAVEKVGESLKTAQDLCQQVDKKLIELGITNVDGGDGVNTKVKKEGQGSNAPVGHTVTFKDEPQSDASFDTYQDEENKENTF